jgi:hypothetical protein
VIRCRNSKAARISVCLLAAMLLTALAAEAATPAQSSSVDRGSGLAYDQTKEVTLVGTVERLVTHPDSGGPAGFHLFISSSGKTIDAHLGPFFSRQNQEALEAGQSVQIVGISTSIGGKDVLLARQLIFGGRLVTVRNERGALVREHPAHRGTRDGKPAVNGGAQ